MDKQKIIVVLLIVAILFSVISAVVTLSVMSFKPVVHSQPKVIYTGDIRQGNPNGGVNVVIQPRSGP